MRVAILTISDSVTRGEREDLSGPALEGRCRELGWEVTPALHCSDDAAEVSSQLRAIADSGHADVVLTTGGTGLGPRDNAPEATVDVGRRDKTKRCGENADGPVVARRGRRPAAYADRESSRESQGSGRIPRFCGTFVATRNRSVAGCSPRLSFSVPLTIQLVFTAARTGAASERGRFEVNVIL